MTESMKDNKDDITKTPRDSAEEIAQTDRERQQNGIHVRSNSCITNDPCWYCGARTDPTGFDFMTENLALVCDRYVEERAPELYHALPEAHQWVKPKDGWHDDCKRGCQS